MRYGLSAIKSDAIPELRPIIKKWCALNRQYLDAAGTDCPWWYNERASISLLAGAVWRSGHIALEEFSTLKGRHADGTHKLGRCDLKIRIGSGDYLFEAKQSWPRLSKKPRLVELDEVCSTLFNKLDDACHGAGRLKSSAGRRFGICFISPEILKTETKFLDDRLDKLIELLLEKKREADSICWFFTGDRDRLRYKRRVYPGTLLLIREAHKYQRTKKHSAKQ